MKNHMKRLGVVTAVVVTGLGTAPAASADSRLHVRPGESIQKAVDAAQPGDTITIAPGTYRESVEITTSNVTLRGSGTGTILKPAVTKAKTKSSKPKPKTSKATKAKTSKTKTSKAKATASKAKTAKATASKVKTAKATAKANKSTTKRAVNACATAGNGICVSGTAKNPVDNVRIRSLTVTGFKKNGIWATDTDGLDVRRVTASNNGQWGIAQQKSTRGVFRLNTARDNAESGIFVANTVEREGGSIDTHGAVIRGNTLTGNRIGVTIRRVRNLVVRGNTLTGNCGGVFVVGDESKPRAGALTIRGNYVAENNKYCKGNSRLPYIQGSGIVLTGAEETLVKGNMVRGHVGESPLSGGIVLFPSFVGAKNERNVISYNVSLGNKPADLVDADTGTNTFNRNVCGVSKKAGPC
ncbi:right-handed parallel beta-helix repeat-containing protein [Streptomyces sp. 8N706]|uniref:right-handed parallel beta-helix repeat-containing protein n=1 Tax=Streptomyces sp. 8N706 TaxID=3457416 RepID=UPI003FD23345